MGCWKVEKPLWLALVFRTVGLSGEGETGRGDLRAWLAAEAGTARASFGLAARASMMMTREKTKEEVLCICRWLDGTTASKERQRYRERRCKQEPELNIEKRDCRTNWTSQWNFKGN